MSAGCALVGLLYDARSEFLRRVCGRPALVVAGAFAGRRGEVAGYKRDLDGDYYHLLLGNGDVIRVRARDVRFGGGLPRS